MTPPVSVPGVVGPSAWVPSRSGCLGWTVVPKTVTLSQDVPDPHVPGSSGTSGPRQPTCATRRPGSCAGRAPRATGPSRGTSHRTSHPGVGRESGGGISRGEPPSRASRRPLRLRRPSAGTPGVPPRTLGPYGVGHETSTRARESCSPTAIPTRPRHSGSRFQTVLRPVLHDPCPRRTLGTPTCPRRLRRHPGEVGWDEG